MINWIKNMYHTVTAKYVVQITYVEIKPGKVPEAVENFFLLYDDKTKQTDFVKEPEKATIFSFGLGTALVKMLRKNKELEGYPNLQIDMAQAHDILFINEVINGDKLNSQTAVENTIMSPIAVAQKSLAEKLLKSPDVFGVNIVGPGIDEKSGPFEAYIEITVKNPDAQNKVVLYLKAHNEYQNIPIVIIISKQPHAL